MIKTFALAAAGGVCLLALAGQALAADPADAETQVGGLIVTARLRAESAQEVPASLSVVTDKVLEITRTDNSQLIAQMVPSLNYSSPNPRNTSVTIRGLGSSVLAIAQSNDGLEPGVGFYVDQVYHARPAAAAFDFLDVERVEVLRGPQGTLFGKNTTAGAINIITKAPSFTPELKAEFSAGDYDYWQAKLSAGGPLLGDKVAGRISLIATERGGVIDNVRYDKDQNTFNNMAVHAQALVQFTPQLRLRLSIDDSSIDNECCTQVYVKVAPTLKAAARQYPALAAGLNYTPPSLNPFDRKTDIDADLGVNTDDDGASATGDWDLGKATVTAVSAWRWWNWDAANDRDYTGIPIQLLQHIPSRQDQYSHELRIASNGRQKIEYVAGLFYMTQTITGRPITGYGPQATYWLLGPAPAFPSNLLDGYTQDGSTRFDSDSTAAFGEATWRITDRLNVTGGLRYTWETKDGSFQTTVSGGAPATGSLLNSKLSILRPQSYTAHDKDGSLSGRASVAYDVTDNVIAYATYADASKSGGINMAGLPLDAANNPALITAVVRPEKDKTYEIGLKTTLFDKRLVLNVDYFDTTVHDFQTNVVDTGPGALRGYLANIEEVHVQGVEFESSFVVNENLSGRLAVTQTDSEYVSYKNGPCPIEKIAASTGVCDLTGKGLSNLPKWTYSASLEYRHDLAMAGLKGDGYARADFSSRTKAYGDPTDSDYTILPGYQIVNATVGFRSEKGWEVAAWARNLFDEEYLQNLTVQSGNSGLIVGTPGDPRSIGVTLRVRH